MCKPNFIYPWLMFHPNIPKPMHGVNPRSIMGKAWWDEQRQKAYAENNHCCWACGVHKSEALYHHWLEAHECYEIDYINGRMTLRLITALCHACHNYIHSGRMAMLVLNGKMSSEKAEEIKERGNKIIEERGLKSLREAPKWFLDTLNLYRMPRSEELVKWGDWRLVIDDQEYPPIHKDYQEWLTYYLKHGA